VILERDRKVSLVIARSVSDEAMTAGLGLIK
jgi:hypothetical protein